MPLKTNQILETLDAVALILKPDTNLHLLGVARPEVMDDFAERGVSSFDSTSPFRQAFMDDRKNYHTATGAYVAIRVPQVDGNARLKRRILAGEVDQAEAIRLERECLRRLRAFDQGQTTSDNVLASLVEYETLLEPDKKSYVQGYERTRRCPMEALHVHSVPDTRHRDQQSSRDRTEQTQGIPQHRSAVKEDPRPPGRPRREGVE